MSLMHSRLNDSILDLRANLRGKEEQIEDLTAKIASKDNEIFRHLEENRRCTTEVDNVVSKLKASESRVVELERKALENLSTTPSSTVPVDAARAQELTVLRSERQRAIDIAAYQRERYRESQERVKDMEEEARKTQRRLDVLLSDYNTMGATLQSRDKSIRRLNAYLEQTQQPRVG